MFRVDIDQRLCDDGVTPSVPLVLIIGVPDPGAAIISIFLTILTIPLIFWERFQQIFGE